MLEYRRATDRPERLDAFLASAVEGLSRRRAQRFIEQRTVTVNGRSARKGQQLRDRDTVELWQDPTDPGWNAAPSPDLPLRVVHEDPHLIAVDKPPGIPTVPLAADEHDTLAGALVARYPECAPLGRHPGDAGLIQRLDRGTSGLALAARTAPAFEALLDLQENDDIEKVYLALVRASPEALPAAVDAPLGPAGRRGRTVRHDPDGRPAHTALEPRDAIGDLLLVQATIHRGFRHQIRAHLAHVGLPIAGDSSYGGPELEGLPRIFLHAEQVRLPHPLTGEPLELRAPLPGDLLPIVRPPTG